MDSFLGTDIDMTEACCWSRSRVNITEHIQQAVVKEPSFPSDNTAQNLKRMQISTPVNIAGTWKSPFNIESVIDLTRSRAICILPSPGRGSLPGAVLDKCVAGRMLSPSTPFKLRNTDNQNEGDI